MLFWVLFKKCGENVQSNKLVLTAIVHNPTFRLTVTTMKAERTANRQMLKLNGFLNQMNSVFISHFLVLLKHFPYKLLH